MNFFADVTGLSEEKRVELLDAVFDQTQTLVSGGNPTAASSYAGGVMMGVYTMAAKSRMDPSAEIVAPERPLHNKSAREDVYATLGDVAEAGTEAIKKRQDTQ